MKNTLSKPSRRYMELSTILSTRLEAEVKELRSLPGKIKTSVTLDNCVFVFQRGKSEWTVVILTNNPSTWEDVLHSSVPIKIMALRAIPLILENLSKEFGERNTLMEEILFPSEELTNR